MEKKLMKKTIGIFAHVDAGKTTFSEQILYSTKSIRSMGRVDYKDAYLDSHPIERERGITIFSDIGHFKYNNSEYYLIDTPGHIDFSPEMERSIEILDYAIMVISGVEGIQGHTETIWKLLEKHSVPVFIFINKMDRAGANLNATIDEISNNFSKDVCLINSCELELLSDENMEFFAERDEVLLELYLGGIYDKDMWIKRLSELIKNRKTYIALSGSALQGEGINEFIQIFDKLTITKYDNIINTKVKARVFKIKYDNKGNRITYIKILEGLLNVRDEIEYVYNGIQVKEKINEIRKYNGTKYETISQAMCGDIVGLIGISSLVAGYGIGVGNNTNYDMIPTLRAKVIFDNSYNVADVLRCFKILEAEDTSLNVNWNEKLQEIDISIMGTIQLEVLKEILKDRFEVLVEFGTPEILYKETIDGSTHGYGHFEPLKHYAEVHLLLESNPRGMGITFENKCHPDFLTTGHQNLIKTHIFEKEHRGLLTGSGVTDIKVTLLDGRAHIKHTEGGDFREATKRAIRQGLETAENTLLEPYYKFKVDVNMNLLGRILSDVQKMNGEFQEPISYGDRVIVEGRGPVSTFMNYPLEFQAFTRGKGSLSLMFDGYDVCHNTDEVIKFKGYNKMADMEYTSSSVFCAKGTSYIVPWNEVKEHMHCLKK